MHIISVSVVYCTIHANIGMTIWIYTVCHFNFNFMCMSMYERVFNVKNLKRMK